MPLPSLDAVLPDPVTGAGAGDCPTTAFTRAGDAPTGMGPNTGMGSNTDSAEIADRLLDLGAPQTDHHQKAAALVAGITADVRREASARGRLLRRVASLHSVALQATRQIAQDDATALEQHSQGKSTRATDTATPAELERWAEEDTRRLVTGELELALKLPRGSAMETLRQALVLAHHLPHVLAQLESGEILWTQARVILQQWSALTSTYFPSVAAGLSSESGDSADGQDTGAGDETKSAPPTPSTDPLQAAGDRLVQEMLERAQQCGASKLRAFGHRRRHGLGAPASERAHAHARRQRSVWVEPEEDGMAHLHALLDAPTAMAVCDRIDQLAQSSGPSAHASQAHRMSPVHLSSPASSAAETPCSPPAPADSAPSRTDPVLPATPDVDSGVPCDTRALPERRADVLADLLLEAEPSVESGLQRGVRGQVSVIVPVEHLVTADQTLKRAVHERGSKLVAESTPASPGTPSTPPESTSAPELVGYGAICPSTAVEIAAGSSSWSRFLTDPATSQVTQYSRDTYTVPAGLRRMLQVRDATCRFPGCRRPAMRCDIDHTVAWEDGGLTDAENLSHLCRTHHMLKHQGSPFGSWAVEHSGTPDRTTPATGVGAGVPHGADAGAGAGAGAGDIVFTSPLGTKRASSPEHTLFLDSAKEPPLRAPLSPDNSSTADPTPSPPDDDPPPF
ncbi:HNH endonuclease signature motif containing protein [Kocuria sp. ZOR0020]|uniref:HNH endonuclease signature motif containing protein n=1 Tax=Kocuria sp. ZOR0020 TaxID=1339234 RepID=UPI001E2E0626|nr:HNH endonuclease signature motif containing protein [Kocuria sp. ZOR0020]